MFEVDVAFVDALVNHHERGVDVAESAVLVSVCDIGACGLVVDVDCLRCGGCWQGRVVVGAWAALEWCRDVEVAEVLGEGEYGFAGAVEAVEFAFGGAAGCASGFAGMVRDCGALPC